MRSALLICTGIVTLALMAGAQIPNNHRKAPQRTTKYSGYRGTSTVRQAVPRRTFSPVRYHQPAFSTARSRQSTFRTTPTRPRMNSSFANRSTMTNTAAWRRTRPPVTNDSRESRFGVPPRPSSAFANRPTAGGIATHRPTRLTTANDWRDSRFNGRPRPSDSVLNRFTMNDLADRRQTRREFNNKWSGGNFRRQTRGSFVNRSRSTAFWSGRRAAVTNNWRGSEFSGRHYWAFHNYQRQWHDSGWWHNHCGDRIVFVTVYSQPFPFYFNAGYWYPAWGYYPDSYYPYDGPIYGYNDLPPDQVIASVQTQLFNEGYYDGPIDGILGPDTRAAIADYQADHGLAVTAAIDEPTVESLGLV
jgi:hypothetical protein